MRFEFATAGQILFGRGVVRETGRLAASLGRKVLLVTGATGERAGAVRKSLVEAAVGIDEFRVPREPDLQVVEQGVRQARQTGCDVVVSCGGGSAIDAGKAIAALLANPGELLDYLEVVGSGKQLPNPALPSLAIPTTAGTGSEVTRNAVLSSPEHRVKVSLRSTHMLPRAAIIDPELTVGLPPEVSISTGLDALTQLIEPYVCLRTNPLTDGYCRTGIAQAATALPAVVQNGADLEAREKMALASLLGGLSLANAGLGAVHGFAGPIGGLLSAPHGAVCAALLPHVMDVNLRALRSRQADSPALGRYREVACLLTGNLAADAGDGVNWVAELIRGLGVPGLNSYGCRRDHFPVLVENAAKASSMRANPIQLSKAELNEVLERAL